MNFVITRRFTVHLISAIKPIFSLWRRRKSRYVLQNLPPFSPIVEIVPEKDGEEVAEADTTTDLRVKLYPEEVLPEDPNGDNVTIRYVWLVDGEVSGIEGDLVVAAGYCQRSNLASVCICQ